MDSNQELDWKLVLLPADAIYPNNSTYVDRAYRAWKESWEPAFRSVGMTGPLFSDAFTRQRDRLALFHKGECAAITLFNWTDLSKAHHRDDSYFGPWPELAIRGLTQQGGRVLVCSYFTVARKFRKGTFEFDVKDLLLGSLVRYFLEGSFDVMTGNTRNSKGIDDICYRWGATPLMKDVSVHGESADLVGFFKNSANPAAVPALSGFLDRLWKGRIIDGLNSDLNTAAAFSRAG